MTEQNSEDLAIDLESLVLRNGLIVDPDGEYQGKGDVLIEGGKIRQIAPAISSDAGQEIDLLGAVVMPGLFDMHVNLREPGGEDSETIRTGALAAARGGFTAVACMPSTAVPIDTRAVIDLIQERERAACGTRIHPVCALTKALEGQRLTEMWELRDTGAVAASDDGHPIGSSDVMRRGMEYAMMCGLPVLAHCEDITLRGSGVMNEGYWSTVLGLRGIPAATEIIGVARNIALAEQVGCQLHILHVSTRQSVDAIRRAKDRGLPVTAETAPHYLTLIDESLRDYEACYKVNPPLRRAEDRDVLLAAVEDGTIDVIASDHAPHTTVSKDAEVDRAPFGVVGLETSFSVAYRALVEERNFDLTELVRRMSVSPRKILGLPGGRLEMERLADLTIIDVNSRWTVDSGAFLSMGRNTPFSGWNLPGKVLLTVAQGRVTHSALDASSVVANGTIGAGQAG